MLRRVKLLILGIVTILGIVPFLSGTLVSARGESWQLVDSTTIRVSGGLFRGSFTYTGANGQTQTAPNPTSITLKPRDGNGQQDPSIWIASSSFLVLDSNGNNFEDMENGSMARDQGEFCVAVNDLSALLSYRESSSISIIHREDCNKPANQIRYVTPGPVSGEYMKCGTTWFYEGWRCNTLWSTSYPEALSGNVTVSYAIPGDPLKCGDPGFVGPCAQPYNPATADCSKAGPTEGSGDRCEAIKACINDAGKTATECTAGWEDCVNSYPDDNINYMSCRSAVSTGDFSEGKYTAPEEEVSSCEVDGIGWIICPVAVAMAGMADFAFDVVSAFMKVAPLQLTPNDNPLYDAWSIMRNIANIAFVIAFLIIIFSQLTGAGITNYGVKKMLPRLVIAAILVNVSFYICALAVDLSNITGVGLQNVFTSITNGLVSGPESQIGWEAITASVLSLGGIAVGAGVAFTALSSTSIWAALVGLLPLLLAALFALIVAFLVLLARQALIIMLIVLAPLAFVAYILPNTEGLYKKWQNLFITLLALFPMLSIVFGASVLASAILRETSLPLIGSDDIGQALTGFFLYIGSLAIMAIPFFITPVLIKLSSGVLNRFAGIVNNPHRGPLDRAQKWAEQKGKNARNRAFMANLRNPGRRLNYGARRRARSNAIDKSLESEANRAESSYLAGKVSKSKRLQKAMAGSSNQEAMQRVESNAKETVKKLEADEIKAANVLIDNFDQDKIRALAMGEQAGGLDGSKSHAVRAAAMRKMIDAQDMDGIDAVIDQVSRHANTVGETAEQVQTRIALSEALAASSSRPGYIGQGAIQSLRTTYTAEERASGQAKGTATSAELLQSALDNNAYSVDRLANSSQDELKHVASKLDQPQFAARREQLIRNAQETLSNPEYAGKVAKQRSQLLEIARKADPNWNPPSDAGGPGPSAGGPGPSGGGGGTPPPPPPPAGGTGPGTPPPSGGGTGAGSYAPPPSGGSSFPTSSAPGSPGPSSTPPAPAGGAPGPAASRSNPVIVIPAPSAPGAPPPPPLTITVPESNTDPGASLPDNITFVVPREDDATGGSGTPSNP